MLRVEEDRVVRYDGVKIKPPAAWGDGARLSGFARAMWSGFVDQSKQSAQAHAPLVLDALGAGLLHRASNPNPLLHQCHDGKFAKRKAIDARGLPHRHEGSLIDKHERHQRQMATSRELPEWGRAA